MAAPNVKLAESLRVLKELQKESSVTMKRADFRLRETDPFDTVPEPERVFIRQSPAVLRIIEMWNQMRSIVLQYKKPEPPLPDFVKYLNIVEEKYTHDAYHSLSIEGYRVNEGLIERIQKGDWDPGQNISDEEAKNAMAARGYFQAFQKVKDSVGHVLNGANAAIQVEADHAEWYQELFGLSVLAGLISAADLAGYRNRPVFIQNSNFVPMNYESVRVTMPEFFNLLKQEIDPFVRVVLGHFIFVFIHPYPDGNGRMGRFLMNVMMASGGYPWTVIELKYRNTYMNALEKASVDKDISPFAQFIASQIDD